MPAHPHLSTSSGKAASNCFLYTRRTIQSGIPDQRKQTKIIPYLSAEGRMKFCGIFINAIQCGRKMNQVHILPPIIIKKKSV
jgi:hypothetical protein